MGLSLTGRGIIQIWCILNAKREEKSMSIYEDRLKSARKQKGRSQKNLHGVESINNCDEKLPQQRHRGRPKKKPVLMEYPDDLDGEYIPPQQKRPRGRPRKQPSSETIKTSNGTEISALTGDLPSGFELDKGSYTVSCLSKNDAFASGGDMGEQLTIENSSDLLEGKLHKSKRGRGRPRKAPIVTKVLEASTDPNVEVAKSAVLPSAPSLFNRIINGDSVLRFEANEKVSELSEYTHSLDNTEILGSTDCTTLGFKLVQYLNSVSCVSKTNTFISRDPVLSSEMDEGSAIGKSSSLVQEKIHPLKWSRGRQKKAPDTTKPLDAPKNLNVHFGESSAVLPAKNETNRNFSGDSVPGIEANGKDLNFEQCTNVVTSPESLSLIDVPASASIQDQDCPLIPYSGNTVNGGDSVISDMTEKFINGKSSGFVVEEKHPPKCGRRRPKKTPIQTNFLDASKDCNHKLRESALVLPSSNDNDRNVHEDPMLRFEVDEKCTSKMLSGFSNEGKQYLGRGCRTKKKLVREEISSTMRDQTLLDAAGCGNDGELTREPLTIINSEGKLCTPKQRQGRPRKILHGGSTDASNNMDALSPTDCPSSHLEHGEDGALCSSHSGVDSTSHGYCGLRSHETYEQLLSEAHHLVIEKVSPPRLHIGGGTAEKNSTADLKDAKHLCTDKSCTTFSIKTFEDTVTSSGTSESFRQTHQNANLKVSDMNERILQGCKESNHQNVSSESGVSRYKRKRGVKEKARTVTATDNIAPIFSAINSGKTSLCRDNVGYEDHGQDSIHDVEDDTPLSISYSGTCLPKDVALPRVVLCLAHMGKVAWDVKWRPVGTKGLEDQHCMGYLAAVLGNGSLEVWEVPLPFKLRSLYTSYCKEGTDPRFIRLKPVFRCSALKCGDRQSIPLALEWSPASPYDLILAGCHDGTVALWKFFAQDSSQDSKPLLRFTADSVPIRAIAWAPDERDAESTNIVVTAGHERLKFWDIRDPYCPFWDFNPVQRHILSVDWLRNPSCIMLSFDDGTLRILNLAKAVSGVTSTGKVLGGPKVGHHYYVRSSFAIWSIQVSRVTGQVAYCSADGSTSRFQLTYEAVEKDSSRYRLPHFLCGSLAEVDQSLCINVPLPHVSLEDIPRHVHSSQLDSSHAKLEGPDATGDCLAAVPFLGSSQSNVSCKTSMKLKNCEMDRDSPIGTTGIICNNGGEKEQDSAPSEAITVESAKVKEVFPSKRIAMHKVRWNMNHGSEKWLCYGGAAGIIRCQEIALPDL